LKGFAGCTGSAVFLPLIFDVVAIKTDCWKLKSGFSRYGMTR
jgi:hypothetical protein